MLTEADSNTPSISGAAPGCAQTASRPCLAAGVCCGGCPGLALLLSCPL